MATPTAKQIHEQAEQCILDLLTDGKASASFAGKQYSTLDISKLQEISEYYRKQAIARGEILDAREKITVSYCRIKE